MLELRIKITKRNVDNNLKPIDNEEGVVTSLIINTEFEHTEQEIESLLSKAIENTLHKFVKENFNYVIPRIPE